MQKARLLPSPAFISISEQSLPCSLSHKSCFQEAPLEAKPGYCHYFFFFFPSINHPLHRMLKESNLIYKQMNVVKQGILCLRPTSLLTGKIKCFIMGQM